MRCDVLVIGGGSAGLAAAVAAARSGCRTLLVEWHATLGGMATAALVHSVCGLYRLRAEPGAVAANPGFATEVAARLLRAGGARGPLRMGRLDVLPHHPPTFARVADDLATATANLEVRFHSAAVAVHGRERIEAVELFCRGARDVVEPGLVVDASGDAVVVALAGAGFEIEDGRRLQRPAYVFVLGGVAPGALDDGRRLVAAHRIASAVRAGKLPHGALGASLREGVHPGEAYVTVDLEGPPDGDYDPTDPRCLAALEVHGRVLAGALADFVRVQLEGFATSHLAALPARVGVRESRRAACDRRIETADIEGGASFPDAVALATWPMEMRERATGARLRFPRDGRPAQIPLGALRVRGVANLLVAGRCISASHEAQASLRVIGTCLASGEAAGLAAGILAGRDAPRADAAAGSPSRPEEENVALAAAVNRARERLMLPFAERETRSAVPA